VFGGVFSWMELSICILIPWGSVVWRDSECIVLVSYFGKLCKQWQVVTDCSHCEIESPVVEE
jgi:hypothetical protein